jgi:threonine dehydrogenase-like Zn-dependent dehydrogenase
LSGHYNLCKDVQFWATPPYDGVLSQYIRHPAAFTFKIPDNMSFTEGALVEPLAIGLHACNQGGVKLGHTVAIMGAGCIGLVTLLAAKAYGATQIIVGDVIDKRVDKARELVSGAENQGDAVKAVCNYIVQNVSYDTDKASQLSGTSGYVPNPDETFSTNKGICFDYASLGAAMLRSVGIPAKIITGYVSPEDLYHAWIMVYIDGSWSSAQFSVNPQSWSRVDLTFAADSSITGLVGDGKTYTERYVY